MSCKPVRLQKYLPPSLHTRTKRKNTFYCRNNQWNKEHKTFSNAKIKSLKNREYCGCLSPTIASTTNLCTLRES